MEACNIPSKIEELSQKINACWEGDEESWHLVKKYQKEELTIFGKPSAEFQGRSFKGEGYINASPEDCFNQCHPRPESTRSQWDSTIKALEIVDMIQDKQWPEVYILRTMAHPAAMGMISARDFVDLIININNDKLIGTMAESVVTEKCPPQKDHVRGINYYCGILCCRVEGNPNQTKLVYIVQTDIGGRIPASLVDRAVPSAICNFYTALRKQLL